MASSGSFSNAYRGYTYKISWTAKQNVAANTSTVTCKHYLICDSSYGLNIASRTHSITVNGTKVTFTSSAINTSGGETILLGTTTHTISHNDSGVAAIVMTAVFSMKATISGTYVESITVPGSAGLDTIARASILSAGNGTLGKSQTLTITRYSSSFRHVLTYTCGTASGTIINKSSTLTSIAWSPPVSLASQNTSGSTVTVKLTLQTFESASATTAIGTDTVTVIMTIPDNNSTKPIIDSITVFPVNPNNLPSAFSDLFIKGYSQAEVTFQARAQNGAQIKSCKISIGSTSRSTSNSYQIISGTLSSTGNLTIKCEVTDSRGATSDPYEAVIYVQSYWAPTVIPAAGESEIICTRALANGTPSEEGTALLIKVGRKYRTLIVDGVQRNFCKLRFRYKKSSDPSYGGWVTIIDRSVTSYDDTPIVYTNFISDQYAIYNVEIGVVDDFGNEDSIFYNVGGGDITFHLREGGGGAAFGQYSQREKALELHHEWDLILHGEILSSFLVGTSNVKGFSQTDALLETTILDGDWHYRKYSDGKVLAFGKIIISPGTFKEYGSEYYVETSIPMPDMFTAAPTYVYVSSVCTRGLMKAHFRSATAESIAIYISNAKIDDNVSTVNINILALGEWV